MLKINLKTISILLYDATTVDLTLFLSGMHYHILLYIYAVTCELMNRFGHMNLCKNLQSVSIS